MERQSATKVQKTPDRVSQLHAQSGGSPSSAHAFLELQRSIGNQAVQRLINSPYIQTKLQVSTPGDPYEQEADRVADTVMLMRACDKCEEKKKEDQAESAEMVHREAGAQTATPKVTTSVAANIHAMNGGGSPLPDTSRAFFEPRFGSDLSNVRVHTDSRAADAAKAINAKAFTVGTNIAFGAGQYQPHSQNGQRLLAHELTHVVQQSGNGMSRVAGGQRISRVEASVQRDLLDDFTGELTNLKEKVVEGAEQVGSAVAGGVEAAGSAVTSGAEALGSAVTSGAQAVASAVGSGAKTVTDAVDSAKEQAAAIGGIATENTEEALETLDWRNLQIDWNSEQGRTIRAWAARLDPDIVRRVRNISPSALFSVVSVPDEIRQAAGELAKQSRADLLRPGIDPRVIPTRPPTIPPGLVPIKLPPVVIIVIIIILAILLTPTNTFAEKGFEDKELEKGRKEDRERRAEEEKKRNEKERGRCRETIPALRQQIHIRTFEELDTNADDFINERFKGENTADELGFFFNRQKFNFFLSVTTRSKNTILKVCSVPNDTLATSSGNKHIRDKLHAEELAAPLLIAQLQSVPLVEREGATLFNVCQSPACVKEVVTNPDGCTAVLEGIRDRFLPGGQVLDEPTGFPPDAVLIPKSFEALLRRLERRIRK